MNFIKKICKVGDSFCIFIPIETVNELELVEDQRVNVDLKLLNEDNIKSYRCKLCEHIFDISDEDDTYCPACDSINLELLD